LAAQAGLLSPGLIDTSVFIAVEVGRRLGALPAARAVSLATIAELQLGVLMAADPAIRSIRLRTLASVEATYRALPLDRTVAGLYAELTAEARRQGRRPGVMDTGIAATAVAHGLPVYTQDPDFIQIPRVEVILV